MSYVRTALLLLSHINIYTFNSCTSTFFPGAEPNQIKSDTLLINTSIHPRHIWCNKSVTLPRSQVVYYGIFVYLKPIVNWAWFKFVLDTWLEPSDPPFISVCTLSVFIFNHSATSYLLEVTTVQLLNAYFLLWYLYIGIWIYRSKMKINWYTMTTDTCSNVNL